MAETAGDPSDASMPFPDRAAAVSPDSAAAVALFAKIVIPPPVKSADSTGTPAIIIGFADDPGDDNNPTKNAVKRAIAKAIQGATIAFSRQ